MQGFPSEILMFNDSFNVLCVQFDLIWLYMKIKRIYTIKDGSVQKTV